MMMKTCPCPFRNALVCQVYQSGTALSEYADLSILHEDVGICCCLALILFLTDQCADVPAYLARMREIIKEVYALVPDD